MSFLQGQARCETADVLCVPGFNKVALHFITQAAKATPCAHKIVPRCYVP